MARIYVFLANGFEEMEALAPVDILRRGGQEVSTVSVSGTLWVESSHGITVKADMLFDECDLASADMLLLPGGMPGSVSTAMRACAWPCCRMPSEADASGPSAPPRWCWAVSDC